MKILWEKTLESREVQENWLIFEDHLLQVHPNEQEFRHKCQEACMDEQGTKSSWRPVTSAVGISIGSNTV